MTGPKIDMVDLRNQYLAIKEEIDSGISEVLKTGAFINGPPVKQFTKDLANYLDVAHVTPCGNGTDALQIALMALGLKPGDEVITVSFTFVATAEVIALLGLKPVFVDIDPKTFTIDPKKIEEAITPRTKCIMPVHLYGQCADMDAIMNIADKHNLYVIEDNAQAIGAEVFGKDGSIKKAGSIGHIGCTSFYPSKNLGAYGDAGAVFSNDDKLGAAIQLIANHGQANKYAYQRIGVNSRLDSFQAVVLGVKLKRLDEYNQQRNKVARFYDNAFKGHPKFTLPFRAAYSSHVFHQYTLIYEGDRDALKAKLTERNIPSMIYYPNPLHLEQAYQYCGTQKGDLPHTEKLAQQVISLPMHTELNKVQLDYIVGNVLELA